MTGKELKIQSIETPVQESKRIPGINDRPLKPSTSLEKGGYYTQLSELGDDANHRTVTDTEKATWGGKQDALGFTPENVANKETSALDSSTTKYPCNKVVKDANDAKLNKDGSNATSDVNVGANSVAAASFKPSGDSPVADGTYTVGSRLTPTGNDGTITIKGGIITAVQQAT